MSQFLQSPILRLRALELEDAPLLHRWEGDSDAWQSAGTLNPPSAVMIRDFIARSTSSILEQGQLSLIMESREGLALGYAQLLDYDSISRRVGLGLYIKPNKRRKGYASEALRLLEEYASQRLACEMLYATILADNVPSMKLFEGLGYSKTASLPRWTWQAGKYIDLVYYQKWISSDTKA